MTPDHWTSADVIEAGQEAYQQVAQQWEADVRANRPWVGTGRRIPLAGRHRRDRRGPATFYPMGRERP
jgi:hypothetical protein